MADNRTMIIKILEVMNPWHFLAVESEDSKDGPSCFSQMMENMNDALHMLMEQGTGSQRPNEGEICAVLHREDNKWYRVRIDSWLEKNKGHYASCYLIDKGFHIKAPVQRLMKLPSKYAELPSQVLHCSLWGIQPISLRVEETFTGLKVENRPCGKWDSSASEFMRKTFDTRRTHQIEVIERDSSKLYVRLILNTKHGTLCFNDVLVEENYAIHVDGRKILHMQTDKKSQRIASPSSNGASPEAEGIPPLVMETPDISPHFGLKDRVGTPASDTGSDIYQDDEEDRCPPLVSETELIQSVSRTESPSATKFHGSSRIPQDSDDQSSIFDELEPPVAAFFKQYMSSPEKSPPPLIMDPNTATPSLHLSKNQQTDQISPPSPQSYPSPEKDQNVLKVSTNQSSQQLSLSSSPSTPLTFSELSSPASSARRVSPNISKFLQGRGRALLPPAERKPGHFTQQMELTPKLPKQASLLKPSASGSLAKSEEPNKSQPKENSVVHTSPTKLGASLPGARVSSARSDKKIMIPNHCEEFPQSQATASASPLPNGYHVSSGHPSIGPANISESGAMRLSKSLNESATVKVDVSRELSSVDKKHFSVSDNNLPLSEGEESTASHASGKRTRFRKSGDSLIELKKESSLTKASKPIPTKIVTLLKTSAPDLRDHAVRRARGQAQGRQFLQDLRQSSGNTDMYPVTIRPGQPLTRPMFGVVVHGKSPPVLTCDVVDVPFDEKVKQILMEEFQVDTARSIQAYVWPASLAGRHVIGVCPPEKGKTMAYVPSIVSLLSDKTMYIELPKGKGPLALVVVPTWKKARDVFEMTEHFTAEESMKIKRIRPLVLYAGGTEDKESTQTALITGCEILIATPASVLRMLEQELTSFKRLCHVVLDDADILATRFADQVDEIMQQFRLVFKDRRHQVVPCQIMMFASRWTDGLDQFRLRYTWEPIVAISSRVEASVYGGIKQVVCMSRWEQRLSTLCSLLDTLVSTDKRVVAFTSSVEEAVQMWKGAKSRGVYCLLIHQDLPEEAAAEARGQWLHSSHSKQLIVMVCTDQCYQDLSITNATDVIHYGLPDSKTKFGNRIACMFDYFRDRTTKEEPEVEAVSHVILTEKCAPRAEQLNEILQRSPSDHSSQLQEFLRGYRMGVETDERRILCPLLKAFGTCIAHNNQEYCKNRHVVVPRLDLKTGEVDENSLPASGQVTIHVLRVVTAGRYYCHLVNYRGPGDSAPQDMRLTYIKLSMDLAAFFSKTSNQVPYLPSEDPFRDGLCAFKDENGAVSRAKVLKVVEGTRSSPMKHCKVWLVDAGCYKDGTVDQLMTLPRSLAEVPYQAVEVYLCCLKPMDDDREWTDQVDIHVHYLVEGKELVGRIMLRAGLTLWLMPLVHQVKVKEVGTTSDISLRQELLQNKFAVKNPDHMKMLYELFRGKTEIPEMLMRQHFQYCLEIELTQETLHVNQDEFVKTNLAAVIDPGLFYLHKEEALDKLEELEAEILEAMKEVDEAAERGEKVDTGMALERGSVCLALSSDGRWYRAKLVSDCEDGQQEVFFLDYGDREWLPESSLRGLPRCLGELPCQAIECELAYVSPIEEEWSPDTVDILCDLSYFANQDKKKLLYAKVVASKEPCYGMGMKLVVDLYETQREEVRFSHELVKRHRAVVADTNDGDSVTMEPILGKPALKNQKFFNLLDKVRFLAANLYWTKDSTEALRLAGELESLLSLRIRGWDSALHQREVLPSVVNVIGYLPDVQAHGVMLHALARCCADSQRLCDVALEHGILERLSSCIEQKTHPDLQTQAAEAIALLLTSESFREFCLETDTLNLTLEQLLSSHSSDTPVSLEVLRNLCKASSQLVYASNESLPSVCSMGTILQALGEATQDRDREPWLELLAAMASKECTHAYLMLDANVSVVLSLLSTCSCAKCLYYTLSTCLSLAKASRKHKKVLLEKKLLIILQGLMETGMPSPALEVGEQLQSVMTLNLPAPEVLSGIPATNNNSIEKVRCPEVLWSQNCFRVVLKVKVQNAQPGDFSLLPNKIRCRVHSGDTLYEFDWELYDNILPQGSKIDIQPTKAIISLNKVTKGQWKRLHKQKQKVFSLKPDMDHLYNSDSDVEEVEDDSNLSKLTQKKKVVWRDGSKHVKLAPRFQSSDESSDDPALYSNSDKDEPKFSMDFLLNDTAEP